MIETIESINLDDSKIEKLKNEIGNFEYAESFIKDCEIKVKEYKKQLPEICPICGAKMKNGKCVEE